jgi:hypothetical protein
MPRTWLPRAEEIIEVLRRMKSKQLDRAAIEELYQLQRRAAIDLMNQVGVTGTRATGFQVDRTSLLSWTERTFKDESWQLQRRAATADDLSQSMAEVQAVREALKKANKPLMTFPIVEEVLSATCSSLPPNITISPGRVSIEVAGPDRALKTCKLLYELGMALSNDYKGFEIRIEPSDNTI